MRCASPVPLREMPRGEGACHEGDGGELLADAVVEVLADAALLALGDADDLALEAGPLGDLRGEFAIRLVKLGSAVADALFEGVIGLDERLLALAQTLEGMGALG